MKLNEIKGDRGSRKKPITVGRGIGSGKGKTCGRGVKGQKARTGVTGIRSFEGGQMPLYRRLPQRGFNNIFRQEYTEVNIGSVQAAIDAGKINPKDKITNEVLAKAGLINSVKNEVKLLAKGKLSAKADFTVCCASASAIQAVEKAGGKVAVTKKQIPETAA